MCEGVARYASGMGRLHAAVGSLDELLAVREDPCPTSKQALVSREVSRNAEDTTVMSNGLRR